MNSPSAQEPGLKVYSAAVLNRHWLSEKTFEIELTRPPSFVFKPGQRIRFISESIERDYSLISTSADPHLGLCVRQVEGGILSPVLASAIAGTRFYFTGPHGYFTFRPSPRRAIFVATGTGIAPFVSMGRSGANGFILLHGVPAASELYYETFFRSLAEAYVPCLSREAPELQKPHGSFQGRVTGYMERHLDPNLYDFYLCGRMEMIRDVTLVVDERFPGSLVYTELFY